MKKETTSKLINEGANHGAGTGGGCFPPVGGVRRVMMIECS